MPIEGEVRRALVVMAHPDDADFSCAGTVAVWTDSGVAVTYLLVTDGDAGGDERDGDGDDMARVRRAEQRAAAADVGVADVRFLGRPDGRVVASLELRRDITRVIRQVRPQLVVMPSPERNWERIAVSHPDHLATGEAALNAVYPDARNPHAHPGLLAEEGLAPWTVREVWLVGSPAPNHWTDVTATLDRKFAALARHASQIDDVPGLVRRLRTGLAANAARAGLPEGRSAEAFQRVVTG
ncbi:PIG-L deacetylase family protein [Marinitenerispora sediminis]|uniref:PIG-L domain-containing protein n=1 Tax=Marinitenerispora sediminis TaxID=1931232 RepID=A0A368T0C8_9ACTN|nr:PIG-L deacetylase family protein [Marinitenerispora sediminis]RCV49580.1 PIG-L domain-containing protein [Marinitenerispora sediminis]RCV52684.1 PIG-L domain-containing protein [Marinitenerispora sediminis]RCV53138.1 PIG-L domain-containing protein [Marinitenerispora sediminis]